MGVVYLKGNTPLIRVCACPILVVPTCFSVGGAAKYAEMEGVGVLLAAL